MPDLKITLVQSDLVWEDGKANLAQFSRKIDRHQAETDLIILPEMFNTGFSMAAVRLAESMSGRTTGWMRMMSESRGCVVTGSVIIREKGVYFNRLIWMPPAGDPLYYDKRHLFRMAGEERHFRAGRRRVVAELKGWRIRPLICYDLRFPVWSRSRGDTDLLLYIANWPEVRRSAWRLLLPARAVENLSYAVGVNRIGKDGNGIAYSGDSAVHDPKGRELVRLDAHADEIRTLHLSFERLREYREKFRADQDADDFTIIA